MSDQPSGALHQMYCRNTDHPGVTCADALQPPFPTVRAASVSAVPVPETDDPNEFCTGACDHDNGLHTPFRRVPEPAAPTAPVPEVVTLPKALLDELTRATGMFMLSVQPLPCGYDIEMRIDQGAAYARLVAARTAIAATQSERTP